MSTATLKRPSVESIKPDELYPKSSAMQILRLGRKGWRDLLDRGLQPIYLAKSCCVKGSDLIAAVESLRDEEPPANRRRKCADEGAPGTSGADSSGA